MLQRMRFEMPVRLVSPLHYGALDPVAERQVNETGKKDEYGQDRLLARNASGEIVLRGTAIAGVLKAACGTEHGQAWGSSDSSSLIAVDDCVLDVAEHRRTGNAINRFTGSVTDGSLYHCQLVPRGTRFTIVLRADCRHHWEVDAVRSALKTCLGLIRSGAIAFGGRTNVGWGLVEAATDPDQALPLHVEDLHTLDGLTAWLANASSTESIESALPADEESFAISVDWRPLGAMFVGAAATTREEAEREQEIGENERKNILEPLVEDGCPVIPGSSIRGALRHRASRIARTVLAGAGEGTGWQTKTTHEQIVADPRLVRRLFGDARHQGALRVRDSRASVKQIARRDHVAIDRWTGGAMSGERGVGDEERGGRLFATDEVLCEKWEPIQIDVRPRLLGANSEQQRAALCLLSLVLAEMATGHVSLGGLGTRGAGQVAVTKVTWGRMRCGKESEGGDSAVYEKWISHAPQTQKEGDPVARLCEQSHNVALELLSHAREIAPANGWTEALIRDERDDEETACG